MRDRQLVDDGEIALLVFYPRFGRHALGLRISLVPTAVGDPGFAANTMASDGVRGAAEVSGGPCLQLSVGRAEAARNHRRDRHRPQRRGVHGGPTALPARVFPQGPAGVGWAACSAALTPATAHHPTAAGGRQGRETADLPAVGGDSALASAAYVRKPEHREPEGFRVLASADAAGSADRAARESRVERALRGTRDVSGVGMVTSARGQVRPDPRSGVLHASGLTTRTSNIPHDPAEMRKNGRRARRGGTRSHGAPHHRPCDPAASRGVHRQPERHLYKRAYVALRALERMSFASLSSRTSRGRSSARSAGGDGKVCALADASFVST
jgi:hypothetical protein